MIAVIDYDAGNLRSVVKAVESLGFNVSATADAETIKNADKVILPGVGSFGDAVDKLRSRGLYELLLRLIGENKPLLGICLGLQLLFEESEESPGVKGLGVLPGKIKRIPSTGLKIPHMGWNSLEITDKKAKIFSSSENGACVYFVHSYYIDPAECGYISAVTDYGVPIGASVECGNLSAAQFHPEKSGAVGIKMLESFLRG